MENELILKWPIGLTLSQTPTGQQEMAPLDALTEERKGEIAAMLQEKLVEAFYA
ncbi:hypothetical protein LCGC14_1690320, partial [marine sediment metagenome]